LSWILAETRGADQAALAEALKLANEAVRLSPDNFHFLDTRGTVLARMPTRLADARADFERCVRLTAEGSMERAKAALRLGRVCVQLGDVTSGRRYLEEARVIDDRAPGLTPAERRELAAMLESLSAAALSGAER